MSTQLSLFDAIPDSDNRPLPLIVADKWNFSLTHITPSTSEHHTYLYAAQDWYEGLAGGKSGWRTFRDTVVSNYGVKFEQAPYIAKNGQTYQVDYVNEKGLYIIAQEMRSMAKRPQLQSIRDYLAAAGVFANLARTQPEQVAKQLTARAKGIQARKGETLAFKETHITGTPKYWELTDAENKILLGATKSEMCIQLNLTKQQAAHFRDEFGDLTSKAFEMAETASSIKMRELGRKLTDSEQLEIVRQCTRMVAPSFHALTDYLNVDKLRNRPLIGR